MSDPHQVSRDILNHTTRTSSSNQSYKTSQDILRSTREEQPQQAPESPIDPELIDAKDWYDRSEQNRENNPRSRKTLKERLADKISTLKQKYPKTAETTRLVGKYVHEKGKERWQKAAARQVAGSAMPGWGNAAWGAYDAVDTYRDLKAFIQHARNHPELKPHKSQGKPYHRVVKEQREKAAEKLEQSLRKDANYQYGKAEYKDLIGQREYKNGMTPNEVSTRIRAQGDKIRYAEITVEEKLSRIASRHREGMQNFRNKSEQWAKEFERNHQQGDARQEYHWMLQQAEKDLGKGYFNPETNPKGVLAYEKFAEKKLLTRHHHDDVRKACAYGIVCEILTQEKIAAREAVKRNNPDLYAKQHRNFSDHKMREEARRHYNSQKPQELFKTPEQNPTPMPVKDRQIDEIER